MALFKISKGTKANLNNQTLTEGYCWFTPEDGKFYIDAFKNEVLTRIPLNAQNADYAGGVDWSNVDNATGAATQSTAGLMSAADKKKLDGIATGAQVNLLESVTASGTAPLTLTAGSISNKSIAISGSIADASTSAKGIVKIGDGISVSNGVISVTAANLGLSNAMHYIGTSTTAVTDGGNENPTINGYSTKTAGDVVIYGNNEYVYTANNKWE
jgi:hypothetical protein